MCRHRHMHMNVYIHMYMYMAYMCMYIYTPTVTSLVSIFVFLRGRDYITAGQRLAHTDTQRKVCIHGNGYVRVLAVLAHIIQRMLSWP